MAIRTSNETEIKPTNVLYSGFGELREDYEDYLRVRGVLQPGQEPSPLPEDARLCDEPLL